MGFKDILSGLGNRNSDFKELVNQRRMERDAEFAVLSAKEKFLQREREKLRREQLDREMDRVIKGWEKKADGQSPLKAKNVWKGKHHSDLNNCENIFKNNKGSFFGGGNQFGFGGGM